MADWAETLPPATTRLVPIRSANGVWVVGYEVPHLNYRLLPPHISWVNEDVQLDRLPLTRAHLNKYNRHKQRPNGRPRHR